MKCNRITVYLCGGWLVCVEYLKCYGCCRRLEQLWSGNTLKLHVDLKHLEPNLPIIKYVAVESVVSLTEMRLYSVSVHLFQLLLPDFFQLVVMHME